MAIWTSAALAAMLAAATSVTVPAATAPAPDPALARLAGLYDEVCLQAFPIDGAVDALMAAKHATPLTPEQVRVTLVADPGRGWSLKDEDGRELLVFLELPPYHACSIRRFFPTMPDLAAYRPVAARFEADHAGFAPVPPYDVDRGDIHVHAVGEQRRLATGEEGLFVYDQHVADPAKRAAGQTAVNLRFVHQIHAGR